MTVETIAPHGFCGGVERALNIAWDALACSPLPVWCLHEIVHNETVVQELTAKGMRFADSVEDVPEGSTMLISAHGASPATVAAAESRHMKIIDATCPFVAAAHATIRANAAKGMRTAIIGDVNHVEVLGYLGEPGACRLEDLAPGEAAGRVVQTTLDSDTHEGVCTATRDRQQAVREFVLASRSRYLMPGVLVVGSARSANTNRLAEIAEQGGAHAFRIDSSDELAALDFSDIDVLGVTSGASTPETCFDAVFAALRTMFL